MRLLFIVLVLFAFDVYRLPLSLRFVLFYALIALVCRRRLFA